MTNLKGAQMEATPIQAIDQRIHLLSHQTDVLMNELDALRQARALILKAANGNGSQATTAYSDSAAYSGGAVSRVTISKPKPKTRRTKTKAKSNGNKTRQGQRAQAILALLKSTNDPLEIPSIARGLGMKEPNYLYRALPRLQGQGLVKSTSDKPPRWTLAR